MQRTSEAVSTVDHPDIRGSLSPHSRDSSFAAASNFERESWPKASHMVGDEDSADLVLAHALRCVLDLPLS
jgi:hypothetical protein